MHCAIRPDIDSIQRSYRDLPITSLPPPSSPPHFLLIFSSLPSHFLLTSSSIFPQFLLTFRLSRISSVSDVSLVLRRAVSYWPASWPPASHWWRAPGALASRPAGVFGRARYIDIICCSGSGSGSCAEVKIIKLINCFQETSHILLFQ